MKKKINIQFLIITLLAILTTVSLSIFVFYELFKQEVMADLKTNTQLLVETDAWEQIVEKKDAGALDDGVKQLRLTLVDGTGEVILDTNAEVGSMDNHSARPEISQALQAGEGQAIRQSSTIGKNAFYYAIRLENGSVLRTAKEAGSITSVFESILPVIVILCVLLFALCMILSHFLTGSIIEPIENLADNLDASDSVKVYKELVPFVQTIKKQHEDIMRNATMRQEFTANVSHELKTPMTAIIGYADTLLTVRLSPKRQEIALDYIRNECRRLSRLSVKMLELTGLYETGEAEFVPVEVQMNQFLEDVKKLVTYRLQEKKICLEIHCNPEELRKTFDPDLMMSAVTNFIDNAVKASDENSKIVLEATQNHLSVQDYGKGIPEEDLKRVTEAFYMVDKSRSRVKGSVGLGLALCQKIADIHGFQLEITSHLGKGTIVSVLW